MLQERTEIVSSFDGCPLYLRFYNPQKSSESQNAVRGVVLVVHGFSEHGGRYHHVAEKICSHNMACVILDLRGHGKSGFSTGDVESGEALILDIQFILRYIQNLFGKDLSYKILGHSFGGLLVTYAMSREQNPHIPIFLSSPCFEIKTKIPSWKKVLAQKLSAFFPAFKLNGEGERSHLSHNEINNEAYERDPLRLRKVSLRLGCALFDLANKDHVKTVIEKILAPTMIVAAMDDLIVSYEATADLVPFYKNGTFYPIEGAGHEIFNEIPEFQEQAFVRLDEFLGR